MVVQIQKNEIVRSALWAAYGDALGFVTELTNASGLRRRIGGGDFETTLPWKRLIGGKFGAFVSLPAGCYSDDTQLRLATCRSIRADSDFDVETFAKIELPVWLAYALGAGTGTKLAASNLVNRGANWFSNFFSKTNSNYIDAGGNGAAMRIQPHVWASRALGDPSVYLKEVIRNSVCTHGHPRGFLGAAFHAMCLAFVLSEKEIPSSKDWLKFIDQLAIVEGVILDDSQLAHFWLPAWEAKSKIKLALAIKRVQAEMVKDVGVIEDVLLGQGNDPYESAVKRIGGFDDATRGSGTKTAVLGALLGWLGRDVDPAAVMLKGATLLHSDTDTICTLAGALLGAISKSEPNGELMDRGYIATEAERLWRIGAGMNVQSFVYPDLITWNAPKNAVDSVAICGGVTKLAGIGHLTLEGSPIVGKKKDGTVWQWARLEFGQKILCKRRVELPSLSSASAPADDGYKQRVMSNERDLVTPANLDKQPGLFTTSSDSRGKHSQLKPNALKTIDQLTAEAIRSGFDPAVIGRHLLEIAERDSEIEQGIAYTAILLKARKARLKSI